jgi:hypothetical protein
MFNLFVYLICAIVCLVFSCICKNEIAYIRVNKLTQYLSLEYYSNIVFALLFDVTFAYSYIHFLMSF